MNPGALNLFAGELITEVGNGIPVWRPGRPIAENRVIRLRVPVTAGDRNFAVLVQVGDADLPVFANVCELAQGCSPFPLVYPAVRKASPPM